MNDGNSALTPLEAWAFRASRPDPGTLIEEPLRALEHLVRMGKVRYFSGCRFSAWQLREALRVSRINHLNSFIVVQARYNILERR